MSMAELGVAMPPPPSPLEDNPDAAVKFDLSALPPYLSPQHGSKPYLSREPTGVAKVLDMEQAAATSGTSSAEGSAEVGELGSILSVKVSYHHDDSPTVTTPMSRTVGGRQLRYINSYTGSPLDTGMDGGSSGSLTPVEDTDETTRLGGSHAHKTVSPRMLAALVSIKTAGSQLQHVESDFDELERSTANIEAKMKENEERLSEIRMVHRLERLVKDLTARARKAGIEVDKYMSRAYLQIREESFAEIRALFTEIDQTVAAYASVNTQMKAALRLSALYAGGSVGLHANVDAEGRLLPSRAELFATMTDQNRQLVEQTTAVRKVVQMARESTRTKDYKDVIDKFTYGKEMKEGLSEMSMPPQMHFSSKRATVVHELRTEHRRRSSSKIAEHSGRLWGMLDDVVDAKLETVPDVVAAYKAASGCLEELHMDPFNSWRDQVPSGSRFATDGRPDDAAALTQPPWSAEAHDEASEGFMSSSAADGAADDRASLLEDAFYRFQHMSLLAQWWTRISDLRRQVKQGAQTEEVKAADREAVISRLLNIASAASKFFLSIDAADPEVARNLSGMKAAGMPLEDFDKERSVLLLELEYLGEDAFALASKEYATFLDDADRPFVQRRRAGVVKDLLSNARMLVDLIIAVSGGGNGGGGGLEGLEGEGSGGLLPSCSQELTSMITRTVSVGRLGSEKIMASTHIRRALLPVGALAEEDEGGGGGGHGARRADATDPGADAEGSRRSEGFEGGAEGAGGSPAAKAEVRRKRRAIRKAGGGMRAKSRGAYTARVVEL